MDLTCQSDHRTDETRCCGQPAVAGIVAEIVGPGVLGEYPGSVLALYPVCADHVAEEVHEAQGAFNDQEYTVVTFTRVKEEREEES